MCRFTDLALAQRKVAVIAWVPDKFRGDNRFRFRRAPSYTLLVKPAIILTLLLLAMAAPLAAQKGKVEPEQNTPESCRTFVQRFYDWYVPLALKETKVAASDLALKWKPAAFDPELSRLLKRDSAAQAKAHEIVGLDFDPFLNSQDPSERFAVQTVTKKGDSYWVDVYGMSSGQKAEHVVPEARFLNGHWQFINFHYDFDGRPDDLISLLKRLEDDRHRPSQ
jgi:hypothetical protein